MLKLKLQYFGHLMRRVDSLEKTLMLGGIGGKRRRGRQKMRIIMPSYRLVLWVKEKVYIQANIKLIVLTFSVAGI